MFPIIIIFTLVIILNVSTYDYRIRKPFLYKPKNIPSPPRRKTEAGDKYV